MDKFVKILSESNPKTEITCMNPDCQRKTSIKTTDFFSSKTYIFKCPHCGKTTEVKDIESELNKLKKEFKNMGITW